MLHHYLESALL